MDDRGYSLRVMRANEQANPSNIGVLLGRVCIKKEITVVDVASFFGVSRMTIYSWFSGTGKPRRKHEDKIIETIQKLGGA
jgi:DNA-binding phage protein